MLSASSVWVTPSSAGNGDEVELVGLVGQAHGGGGGEEHGAGAGGLAAVLAEPEDADQGEGLAALLGGDDGDLVAEVDADALGAGEVDGHLVVGLRPTTLGQDAGSQTRSSWIQL